MLNDSWNLKKQNIIIHLTPKTPYNSAPPKFKAIEQRFLRNFGFELKNKVCKPWNCRL